MTQYGGLSILQLLLLLTRDLQATDPRDKTFGLLGLATDCQTPRPSELQPDYHKTTASLYSDATKYMIQSSQSLGVLSQIGYIVPYKESVENAQDSYPSWVPRWELALPQDPKNTLCAVHFCRDEGPYAASGRSTISLNAQVSESNMLLLQGLRIDKIKSLSHTITALGLNYTGLVSSLWTDYASKLTTYPTGESSLKAFSFTLVADTTLNKTPASKDPLHNADFAAYISTLQGKWEIFRDMIQNLLSDGDMEQGLFLNDVPQGKRIRYGHAADNAMSGRSFCITEAGWMGLCPPTAREGDLICLLFGGSVLYVIRRERRHSTFVGDCYFHGRMDGSAYDDQVQAHAPVEMFSLR